MAQIPYTNDVWDPTFNLAQLYLLWVFLEMNHQVVNVFLWVFLPFKVKVNQKR